MKTLETRLTVTLCYPSLVTVIEKSKKLYAFKNLNLNVLPVNYYAQKSAWNDVVKYIRILKNYVLYYSISVNRHYPGPDSDG